MANPESIGRASTSSALEGAKRIAFESLGSTFLAAGTLAASTWLLGFWSLIVRARISTGEWPHPQSGWPPELHPSSVDPKTFGLHADLVGILFPLMGYAVPLAMLVLLVSAPFKRLRQDPRLVAAFLLSSTLAAGTVFLDPGGFFLWFLD